MFELGFLLFEFGLELLELDVLFEDGGEVFVQFGVLLFEEVVLFGLLGEVGVDFRQLLLHLCDSSHIVALLLL